VGGQVENVTLDNSNYSNSPTFDTAVSLSNNTLLFGFPRANNEKGTQAGEVVIYSFESDSRVKSRTLLSPDGASYSNFGENVKVDEDILIVIGQRSAANYSDAAEQAYIYNRGNDGQWVPGQTLTGTLSDGRTWNSLRDSIDVDGDTLFIGSPVNDGHVFVYNRDSSNSWNQTQLLEVAFELGVYGDFGSAIAIDGDIALIGANGLSQ
jgi:hypothetical protein